MKFKVNENCIGCSLCAGTCPEVFYMTDEGVAAALPEEVSAQFEELALTAQSECPASAIETV